MVLRTRTNYKYITKMNAQIILQRLETDASSRQHGILQINVDDTDTNAQRETTFIVVVDLSGSMDDRGASSSKSRTRESKLDQLKFVLKNIVRFIANNTNGNVWFKLIGFSNNVFTIIPIKIITKDNLAEIIARIDEMYADESTNIEKALIATHDNPVIPNCHILVLSDGEAHEGNTDPIELAKLVNPNATNSFLGFGLEHDPYMFNTLAATLNSSYFFIQDKEKAGIAYGEILYGALHNRYTGIVAIARNCELYDYKMGKWTDKLYIGRLASNDSKKYHIRKIDGANDSDVHIDILSEDTAVICSAQFDGSYNNLTEMMYRLRTLELLYKVAMFEKGEDIEVEDSTDESDDDDFSIQRRNAIIVEAVEDINEPVIVKKTYNERLTELKIVLKQLLCEMIEYMKTINDKQFIKNLCDDIAIVLKTIGTQYGEMLTYSRQHSQGEERAHQVTNISEIEENIQRSGAGRNQHSYKRGASRASYDSDSDDELPERACMSAGPSSTQVCSQIAYAASSDSDEEEWEDDEEEEENAQKASNGFCSVERSPEPSSITPVDDIIDNYDISDNLETTCSQTKLFVIRSISGN